MSDELLKLAARCEAATGPDRELDAAIGVGIGFNFVCRPRYEGEPAPRYGYVDENGSRVEPGQAPDMCVKRYTASLDAAMTLFPDGYFPVLDADPRGIEVEVQYLTDKTDNGLGACVVTGGKTIALALCAAALRAAQEMGK